MFILIGILFIAGLILFTLYYFVFIKFHKVIGFVLLAVISFMMMFTGFMHLIISAIVVFAIGLFLIKIAEQNKTKRKNV
jgi:hypothetical protein